MAAQLSDEHQVLKHFSSWPNRKYDILREVAALMAEMQQMCKEARSEKKWGEQQIRKEGYMAVRRRAEYELGKLQQRVDALLRDKDNLQKKFEAENVPCDFELLTKVRHASSRIGGMHSHPGLSMPLGRTRCKF